MQLTENHYHWRLLILELRNPACRSHFLFVLFLRHHARCTIKRIDIANWVTGSVSLNDKIKFVAIF